MQFHSALSCALLSWRIWREPFVLLLAGIVAALVFARWKSKTKVAPKLSLPPGPPPWPVIGHLHLLVGASHTHRALHRIAEEYGPIVHLRLGGRPVLLISSPEMAREVLKTHDQNFASRPQAYIFENMGFKEGSIALSPYGPRWRFLRKVATLELLTHRRIQQFAGAREQEMSEMVRSISVDSARHDAAGREGVNLQEKLTALMMNLMTRMLMGKRYFNVGPSYSKDSSAEAAEFVQLLHELIRLYGVFTVGDHAPYLSFLDWLPRRQITICHGKLDTFLNKILEEHREHNKAAPKAEAEQDFTDVLLALDEHGGGTDLPFSDNMIKGLILDMIGAGVDTSSVAVEWAMAELIRNPRVMELAQQELDWNVGRQRRVQESDLPGLPYLQAIIKETLRIHPAAALLIPHVNIDACQVAGYDIPAGMTVLVSLWSIGRSQSVWENPLEFIPERFVGRDFDITGHNFEHMPFGSGRRGCPGVQLGLTHAQYALAQLLHSFNWCLPHGGKPEELDMMETYGLTLPRTIALQAVPSPRLPQHLY